MQCSAVHWTALQRPGTRPSPLTLVTARPGHYTVHGVDVRSVLQCTVYILSSTVQPLHCIVRPGPGRGRVPAAAVQYSALHCTALDPEKPGKGGVLIPLASSPPHPRHDPYFWGGYLQSSEYVDPDNLP